MTNEQTESLLTRFAAVDQRLKGTGAPGVPYWIYIDDDGEATISYVRPPNRGYDYSNDMGSAYNHEAALAGCVVWAMEVAWGYAANKNAKIRFEVGYHGCHSWWLIAPDSSLLIHGETNKGVETAWLMFLESIADAIGGG